MVSSEIKVTNFSLEMENGKKMRWIVHIIFGFFVDCHDNLFL